MAHCYSITVEIDGKEHEICTTHVPGNEQLARDIAAGRTRKPTAEETQRAVDYFRGTRGSNRDGMVHTLRAPRQDAESVPWPMP
jgi:hypothetical protein